jgi:hypothetical protein
MRQRRVSLDVPINYRSISQQQNVETQKKGEEELIVSGVKSFVKVNEESVCGELVFRWRYQAVRIAKLALLHLGGYSRGIQ